MDIQTQLKQSSGEYFPVGDHVRQRRGTQMLQRMIGTRAEFSLHDVHSPRRSELQDYIAACFESAYGANVTEFAPLLLELNCAGNVSGVAGMRPAVTGPLFLEQYLDEPVERTVADVTGQQVERRHVVELGNLAAHRPGACQLINIMLAATLHAAGFRYACLVGTAKLERIVRKQQFAVRHIRAADPQRLGASAESWGSYYATCPNLIAIDLEATLSTLNRQMLAQAICRHFALPIQQLSGQLAPFSRPGQP